MTSRRPVGILLLSLLVLALFPSCHFFLDNGVEPFGNAYFHRWNSFPVFTDITWLYVDDELYYLAGAMDRSGTREGECIAAFHDSDHYSFSVYRTKGNEEGILFVHGISRLNMVDMWYVYVSAKAKGIPASYLDDFPHYDSWFDKGREKVLDGKTYCIYGSTQRDFRMGEFLFSSGGIDYYAFPGESLWLGTRNTHDTSLFDLYYEQNAVKELPASIVKEVVGEPIGGGEE